MKFLPLRGCALAALLMQALIVWRLTGRVADLEWASAPRDREWWSVVAEAVEPPPHRAHVLMLQRVAP